MPSGGQFSAANVGTALERLRATLSREPTLQMDIPVAVGVPQRASSPGEVYGHRTIRAQANVRLGADYGRTRTRYRAMRAPCDPHEMDDERGSARLAEAVTRGVVALHLTVAV